MNSGSEKKLSMDELMERNRPVHTVQTTQTESTPEAQETPPSVVIQCPMPEVLDKLEHRMRYLEKNSSSQTEYLRQLTEMRGWLPTRTQMDELLKRTAHLEQMTERAGKPKGRSFSLPRIKLRRLRLPHPDGPTWVVLLMVLAALLLLWWGLGDVWSNLGQLLR